MTVAQPRSGHTGPHQSPGRRGDRGRRPGVPVRRAGAAGGRARLGGVARLPFALATVPHWALIHEAVHGHLHPRRGVNDGAGPAAGDPVPGAVRRAAVRAPVTSCAERARDRAPGVLRSARPPVAGRARPSSTPASSAAFTCSRSRAASEPSARARAAADGAQGVLRRRPRGRAHGRSGRARAPGAATLRRIRIDALPPSRCSPAAPGPTAPRGRCWRWRCWAGRSSSRSWTTPRTTAARWPTRTRATTCAAGGAGPAGAQHQSARDAPPLSEPAVDGAAGGVPPDGGATPAATSLPWRQLRGRCRSSTRPPA